MTRKFVAQPFTAQEQHQKRIGELTARLIYGQEDVDPRQLINDLLETCEHGERRTFEITLLPLRLGERGLTLIATEDSAAPGKPNCGIKPAQLDLPPNFSFRLWHLVAGLLETERQLKIAESVPQNVEAVEKIRDTHVNSHKAYINERLGIVRGRPGEYDLSQLPSHYNALRPVWKLAKRIFKDNQDCETWRAMVVGEIKSKLSPTLVISDDDLNQLIERLGGLNIDQQQRLNGRNLQAAPSDLALDHAALLCGVPFYHYTLRHLQASKQKRESKR